MSRRLFVECACIQFRLQVALDCLFHRSADMQLLECLHIWSAVVACTRFRRHRVRCFYGTGGESWRGGSLHESSSLRRCG